MEKNCDKKKIWLVTGASGHLGNAVIRRLLNQNGRVRAFIFEKERPEALKGLDCEIVSGNILDRASLEPLFAGLDGTDVYVLHLAGKISICGGHDPSVFKINVEGTDHIIDASIAHGVKRFCYCSTVHAIPLPDQDIEITETAHFDPDRVEGSYAKSKAMATSHVLNAVKRGLPAVVVHPVGIIGPLDYLNGHMSRLIARFVDRRLPGIIDGKYNFADVRDIADGAVRACESGRIGACYILSGHVISIMEMLNTVAETIGRKKIKRTVPLSLANMAVPLAEAFSRLMNRPPIFTAYSLKTLQTPCRFICDKAKRELGYRIRPIRDTLQDMVAFLNKRSAFRRRIMLRRRLVNNGIVG